MITDKLYRYDGTAIDIYASNKNRLLREPDLVYTYRRGNYYVQAACYDSNRNCFYAIGNSTSGDGNARLFAFSDWRHPENELRNAVLTTGHSNSIAYNPISDELLVTGGGGTTAGELAYANDLAVIDAETLTITRRITYSTEYKPDGVAFCGDCICVHVLVDNQEARLELRTLDLNTVLMDVESPKSQVSNYFGYPVEGCIVGQSLTYDPETEMIYRVYSGYNTGYTPNGTEHLAEYNYGILAGYSKTDLKFQYAIAIQAYDKEEIESYIFGGDFDYILANGNYIMFSIYSRNLPKKIARTAIPSGADVNTYFNIGEYFSNSAAISSSLLNIPTISSGFTLMVYQAGNDLRAQVITVINGNVFFRVGKSTSDWTAWKKVSMTNA